MGSGTSTADCKECSLDNMKMRYNQKTHYPWDLKPRRSGALLFFFNKRNA